MAIKFGTDGWRAIIDQDFNEENVSLAAQAIANYLHDTGKSKVIIGYDIRRKADHFARLVAQVLAGSGIQSYLTDAPCGTPLTGWSIIDKKADGGMMLTASHNPPEFLGLKYMTEEAMVAPSEVTNAFMKNLEKLKITQIKKEDFQQAKNQERIILFDPTPAYFKKLKTLIDLEKIRNTNLKVLINPMFGVGYKYLPELLKGGSIKIEVLNGNPDPNFGGRTPEPVKPENAPDAIEKMKTGDYDVCVMVDGDADRIGLIDENGRFLTGLENYFLLVYYFKVIKKKKGPVVRNISNTVMADHLGKIYGFEVFETPTGFKYVGEKMKKTGAIFGGEDSGGSAVSEYMLVRDGQFMNLCLLDLMRILKKPLSKILEIAQKEAGGAYYYRRDDNHLPYESYEKIKAEQSKELTANPPKEILGKKVVKTRTDDGMKFWFSDDSWLLVRFSGTEPLMRIYAEAKSMAEVEKLIGWAKEYFKIS